MLRNNIESPKYLTLYYFTGRFPQTYVGHTAISDGENFYSYGGAILNVTHGNEWIVDQTMMKTVIPAEEKTYGPLKKVILPVNLPEEKWRNIRERLSRWDEVDYHLLKHNCVGFVKFYLNEVGYPDKMYGLSSVLPSTYIDDMRELGKDIISQIIQQGKYELNNNESLGKCVNTLIGKLSSREQKAILTEKSISLKYYKLLEILALKHYSGKGNEECNQLYADALAVCPVLSKFAYKPAYSFFEHPFKNTYYWTKDFLKATLSSILGMVLGTVPAAGGVAAMGMGLALGILSIPVMLIALPIHFLTKKNIKEDSEPLSPPSPEIVKTISIYQMLDVKPEIVEPKQEKLLHPENDTREMSSCVMKSSNSLSYKSS